MRLFCIAWVSALTACSGLVGPMPDDDAGVVVPDAGSVASPDSGFVDAGHSTPDAGAPPDAG